MRVDGLSCGDVPVVRIVFSLSDIRAICAGGFAVWCRHIYTFSLVFLLVFR